MDRRTGRGYRGRRRHRRGGHTFGGSGRRSPIGSPLVWIASAAVVILLIFWTGTVLKLALLPPENNELADHTDSREKLTVTIAVDQLKAWGKGGGSGAGGDGIVRPSKGRGSEARRDEDDEAKEAMQRVYTSVDFKGGDIQGVGPIHVVDQKECHSLCVRDGRCLKWTLQSQKKLCWLKDAGGTRNEGVAGVISGVVRTKQDKTVPTQTYGREPPPPPPDPLQCCPDGAAEAPPGVHPLDLWDDEPGSDWTTEYALGNGHLGAMLGLGTFKDTIFMSDGSLWAGKAKAGSGFPQSPDRYQQFLKAREALLEGDIHTAQEAAGRMSTGPDMFVGSFEYAGELHVEFDEGGQAAGGGLGGGHVDGYIRHLHLNNGTAEATFGSISGVPANRGGSNVRHHHQRRLLHHREAFASNVDGVLAMRLSCKEEESGRGCLSLLVTPKREGHSFFSEAGQLVPPPRARRHENAGAGEGDHSWDRGAYVGLFRPPRSGKHAEMGFHMCVAVFPLGKGEGSGAVAEEYVEPHPPPQPHRAKGAKGEERPDDHLEMARLARLADGPGAVPGRKLSVAPNANTGMARHRIALSADDARSEAVMLVSIVTEGDGERQMGTGEGRGEGGGGKEGLRRRCLDTVEAAAGLGYEELRRRHAEDVGALFDRVHFSLGPSSDGSGASAGRPGEATGSRSSGSCVAGLPIRVRVSRSGKACTEKGAEGRDTIEGVRVAGNDRDNEEGLGQVEKTVVVDDGLIELMYHYGRYLMISGSRQGGRPLNLQGVWANSLKAKWEGDYHMNINLQMNYWGAHTAGLPECASPLVPFVEALSHGGRQTAHSYYRAPGWVSHANSDRWGGTAAHGDAVWALCPTCGAWMALHLWEAYEYTGDVSMLLSSVVPVLEGAVLFFLEYMILADDGLGDGRCLLTGPSTSPENSLPAVKNIVKRGPPPPVPEKGKRSETGKGLKKEREKPPPDILFPFVAMSPAIDVAILRQLLENFVDASQEALVSLALLEKDSSPPSASLSLAGLPSDWTTERAPRLFNPPGPWRGEETLSYPAETTFPASFARVSERLRRLSERSQEALLKLPNRGRPSIGNDGMLREYRGVDTSDLPDPGHRHFSGLWGLYPGFQISPSQGEHYFGAAAATVQYKIDKGGGHTSWSRAWLVNLQARLFQGTEALDSLRGVLRDQCVGSLYSLHPALSRTRGKELAQCLSCYEFREEGNRRFGKKKARQQIENGLVTGDGAAFQIDGNLGFLAGVNEMLLQSQYRHRHSSSSIEEGRSSAQTASSLSSSLDAVDIRFLPALPEDWPDGCFRGLRTRGGYEVDVVWDQRQISTASVRVVASGASVAGAKGVQNRSPRLEVKSPRLRVLSRTQLTGVVVLVGGREELVGNGGAPGIPSNEPTGVFEGGVFWYSVSLEPLRPGEEARFVATGS